jgi:hypothetical protein
VEPMGPEAVTELLLRWRAGDQEYLHRLLPRMEGELRRIAHRYIRMERQGHTLQTTALVNEAYLKLVDQAKVDWQNRAHFLGVAARLMRHILVDPLERCASRRPRAMRRPPGVPFHDAPSATPLLDMVHHARPGLGPARVWPRSTAGALRIVMPPAGSGASRLLSVAATADWQMAEVRRIRMPCGDFRLRREFRSTWPISERRTSHRCSAQPSSTAMMARSRSQSRAFRRSTGGGSGSRNPG